MDYAPRFCHPSVTYNHIHVTICLSGYVDGFLDLFPVADIGLLYLDKRSHQSLRLTVGGDFILCLFQLRPVARNNGDRSRFASNMFGHFQPEAAGSAGDHYVLPRKRVLPRSNLVEDFRQEDSRKIDSKDP